MIIVYGSVETTPDGMDEALELSLEHVRRSRSEPGCVRHDAHVHAENPNRIVFFEEWESMERLRDHFAVPDSREFVARVSRLAIAPPTIRIFDARETG